MSERFGIDQLYFFQLFNIDVARMLLLSSGQGVFDSEQPEWGRAIALVACYSMLCILLGDDDPIKIAEWMTSYHLDLGKAPIQLLMASDGIEKLEQFLLNFRCV